ncbi:BAR domain-containing protein [Spirosoma sordidisoli]|uniref:DinB family protein n=1 Tax=Spirosoma sordidisoli TaxID=2502893 RepID=A0A4Q2UU07_9BACT|nr:DinB family protein [Spirosoma sordidisoli]RYC71431.1 DinB family protein [Spirosoma sordidisoli]
MCLKSASTDIMMQLADVIGQLTDHDYARPLSVLSGNTIGKHVRHILEFYELLVNSARTGLLNYDQRQRDLRLEVNPDEAIRRIGSIDRSIQRLDLNQYLQLEADLSVAGAETIRIPSSFARELLYNVEHAIHHMALIQVAVMNAFPDVDLPPHFGVAYSTVQHQSH